MTLIRWIYNRIGQMICFSGGALGLATGAENFTMASVAIGAALLATGLCLKAIFHWRQMSDPTLV